MNCDRILKGKVIVTIQRLGVPIGYIKDRRALAGPAIAGARRDLHAQHLAASRNDRDIDNKVRPRFHELVWSDLRNAETKQPYRKHVPLSAVASSGTDLKNSGTPPAPLETVSTGFFQAIWTIFGANLF
jgi:hypothetical protein